MITILKKTDIALIVSLVVIAVGFYFVPGVTGDDGEAATVVVGGAVYGVLPLSEDAALDVYLAGGVHSNTVVVKDGEAYMAYADCPDGLCLARKPARTTGEIIVCLPNRVVVEITGGDAGYDAVAG